MKGKTITGIFKSLTIFHETHIRVLNKLTFHELRDGNKNGKLSSNYINSMNIKVICWKDLTEHRLKKHGSVQCFSKGFPQFFYYLKIIVIIGFKAKKLTGFFHDMVTQYFF